MLGTSLCWVGHHRWLWAPLAWPKNKEKDFFLKQIDADHGSSKLLFFPGKDCLSVCNAGKAVLSDRGALPEPKLVERISLPNIAMQITNQANCGFCPEGTAWVFAMLTMQGYQKGQRMNCQ